MAYLDKLFKFEKEDNFEEFINALTKGDDSAKSFLSFKPSQKVVKEGDGYKFVIITPKGEKVISFIPGVPFDEAIREGLQAKSVVSVEGGTFTQVQDFGDKGTVTFKREFTPDSLKVTMTTSLWDGAAHRYYVPA